MVLLDGIVRAEQQHAFIRKGEDVDHGMLVIVSICTRKNTDDGRVVSHVELNQKDKIVVSVEARGQEVESSM